MELYKKLSFEEFKQQHEESLSKKFSSELDSYFLRDPNAHMDILLKEEYRKYLLGE